MGKPCFDQHSENTRSARGVEGLKEYYVKAALGSVIPVCRKCAMITRDIEVLELIGFDTVSAPGGGTHFGQIDIADPMLVEDNLRALRLMTLVLNHIRLRVKSMSWHSDGLPGVAALWLSTDETLHAKAWDHVINADADDLEM